MKIILSILISLVGGWYYYSHYIKKENINDKFLREYLAKKKKDMDINLSTSIPNDYNHLLLHNRVSERSISLSAGDIAKEPKFRCDGRRYCSQMRSCEEAMFFLHNCPNVKLDKGIAGEEANGIPCESEWCN